ncbi:MAG: hypothetical protein M1828_005849 [Chrysothrix sp. TS-e1954]|nr:MAG: hypothetical protein M1828_005849 [Chrysothrix sp. TS-e1954]
MPFTLSQNSKKQTGPVSNTATPSKKNESDVVMKDVKQQVRSAEPVDKKKALLSTSDNKKQGGPPVQKNKDKSIVTVKEVEEDAESVIDKNPGESIVTFREAKKQNRPLHHRHYPQYPGSNSCPGRRGCNHTFFCVSRPEIHEILAAMN